MIDNTNTILLAESGDLEVYEGKEPAKTIPVQYIECCFNPTKYGSCCGNGIPTWKEDHNPEYYQWQSTKKVVKMAEGERDKLVSHISKGSIISAFKLTYPIDVSDFVTLKPTHKTPTDHFLGHLGEMELQGYFTPPPVDKEEETQEDLIRWAEIKSVEEGLDGSVYQPHFEDGFISAVKYIFENYTLKRR